MIIEIEDISEKGTPSEHGFGFVVALIRIPGNRDPLITVYSDWYYSSVWIKLTANTRQFENAKLALSQTIDWINNDYIPNRLK